MKKNNITHIGIVGESIGSSLLCLEAKKRGIKTTLLDSTLDSMSARFADEHLIADASASNIQKLALRVDAIIFGKDIYTNYKEQPFKNVVTYPSIEMMELLKNKISWLRLAAENDVPTPKYFYQENSTDVIESVEDLPFPFDFYQYYPNHVDVIEVETADQLNNFIFEIDENADSWLSIAAQDYDNIISVTGIVDATGKIYTYELSNEVASEDEITMYSPAKVNKTAGAKITRYTKKLLKVFGEMGIYTFLYGIKSNKGIELMDVTLEMDEHQVMSLHYYDISVYEQFLNMIEGEKVVTPTQMIPCITHKIFAEDLSKLLKTKNKPCHIYELVPDEKLVLSIQEES